jgi:hypothetical protein
MTQAVVQVRNIVARSGFANPLTLEVLVTDEDYLKVYADTTLLDNGPDYAITGIGDPNGVSIEIIGAEDVGNYVGVITFTALYDPPLDQQGSLAAGGVLGRAFESALDQQNRRLQSLGDRVDRAIKMPVNVDGDTVVGEPVDQWGLVWDDDAGGFIWAPVNDAGAQAAALPIGGTTGQLLRKASDSDFDTEWFTGEFTAAAITFAPAGGIAAATVQAAIEELDTEKLSIASAAATYLSQAAAAATYLTIAAAAATYLTLAGAAAAYQPLNSGLTSISALTTTAFGRSLLTQADAAAARTTLGITASVGGTLGATDNVVPRSDGTGGATLQASGVAIDDSNYVTGIARITLDAAPAFDLASGQLATWMLISGGATTPITVTDKTFSAIRLSETGGGNLVFAVTDAAGVASGVYSSVEAHSTSDAGSDVYGAVLHSTNAGPGTTRGAHIGGYGVTGSTGILNALAAELQPVSTQGFTSGLFVALNSTGVHDKALGVAVESGNGDRFLVAYGNGVSALPVGAAYLRIWMATASSAGARAVQILNNGATEIAYWHKDGVLAATAVTPFADDGGALGSTALKFSDLFLASGAVVNFNSGNLTLTHSAGLLTSNGAFTGTVLLGTTSLIAVSATNGITITQAEIARNHANGSITFSAGTAAGNTFAIATGGSTRFDVSDTASRANGYLHALLGTAVPAGGTAGAGLRFSSATNFGIFFGSGAPTLSAAQGSLYLRSDGSSTSTRLYVNTTGSTTWTNVTTAA